MKRKQRSIRLEGLAPIWSEEAEKNVLAAMLSGDDESLDAASAELNHEDFFNPVYEILFRAMVRMHSDQKAVDVSTVYQFLEDHKMAETIGGGAAVLGEMASTVIPSLTVRHWIKVVKDKSLLRRTQQACAVIAYDCQERQHEPQAVVDEAEQKIFGISERQTGNTASGKENARILLEAYDRASRFKGTYDGIPSGFKELDDLTTAFKAGEMIVIAARPGVGKTALALNMSLNMLQERWDEEQETFVKPGYGVGIFSLEMTNEQLLLRMGAADSGVPYRKIKEGSLSQEEVDRMCHRAEQFADYPLYLDDSSMLSISQIRARTRRWRKQYGVSIIMIDYLQLLTSNSQKARDNRQVEVAEISRGIKGLALELKIPIIVMAQINRKAEEGNGEPQLHHLRESGSIEQDADVVILLSREFKGGGGVEKATANVAKQRNGPTDKVHLGFDKDITKFKDWAYNPGRDAPEPKQAAKTKHTRSQGGNRNYE